MAGHVNPPDCPSYSPPSVSDLPPNRSVRRLHPLLVGQEDTSQRDPACTWGAGGGRRNFATAASCGQGEVRKKRCVEQRNCLEEEVRSSQPDVEGCPGQTGVGCHAVPSSRHVRLGIVHCECVGRFFFGWVPCMCAERRDQRGLGGGGGGCAANEENVKQRRGRRARWPRGVAMSLLKKQRGVSLEATGKFFWVYSLEPRRRAIAARRTLHWGKGGKIAASQRLHSKKPGSWRGKEKSYCSASR